MPIIDFNNAWMLYNSVLAFLAVGFGYVYIRSKSVVWRVVFGVLWLLFLPNTIYIYTDLEHLIDQWPLLPFSFQLLLLGQYLLFQLVGIITFLIGFLPFESVMEHLRVKKKHEIWAIIVFNFLIAYGVVLGRVERINSWEVFTAPLKVLNSAQHVLITPELVGLTALFGLFGNFSYFLFRNRLLKFCKNRRFFGLTK